MSNDNWITYTGLGFLFFVLLISLIYANGAFAQQTVIAQCDNNGICFTTKEVLELILQYIQQLEMKLKGKYA